MKTGNHSFYFRFNLNFQYELEAVRETLRFLERFRGNFQKFFSERNRRPGEKPGENRIIAMLSIVLFTIGSENYVPMYTRGWEQVFKKAMCSLQKNNIN